MSNQFYRLGAANRQDGIIESVFDGLPNRLCRSTQVRSGKEIIDERVVCAVVSAVRLGWIAARKVGTATVIWEDQILKVRYGGSAGLVGDRGIVSDRVRSLNLDGYRFYGYRSLPQRYYGETIVTRELYEAVCAYRFVIKYLEGRVKHSYAQMMIFAGELSVDLADAVRQKIDEEFNQNRSIQAPEGSNLIGNQVSLTDISSAMQPFRERIAHEAGLPMWLIFPDTVSTKYELENRADYLQTEYNTYVKPAIVGVFKLMGQDVAIDTPTFRDEFFGAEVVDKLADAEYKKSAQRQNDSSIKLAIRAADAAEKAMAEGTPKPEGLPVPATRKGRRR